MCTLLGTFRLAFIINGILIFYFQKSISRKFNKIEVYDERKKEIVEKFYLCLNSLLDTITEIEGKFKFRESLEEDIKSLIKSTNEMTKIGRNMDFILNSLNDVEKVRAKTGYVLVKLNLYHKEGSKKFSEIFEMDEVQLLEQIDEVRNLLKQLIKKTIKK